MGGKEIGTMSAGFKNKKDLISNKIIESKSEINEAIKLSLDSQVKIKKGYSTRRSFDTAYKLRVLAA